MSAALLSRATKGDFGAFLASQHTQNLRVSAGTISAAPPTRSPGTLDGHGHGGGVCVCVCGCPRPLHRWLQVQRHAWLITKGLQSSGRHLRPFLPRAGGGAGAGRGGGREQARRWAVVLKRVSRRGNEPLSAGLFFSVVRTSAVRIYPFCVLLLRKCVFFSQKFSCFVSSGCFYVFFNTLVYTGNHFRAAAQGWNQAFMSF